MTEREELAILLLMWFEDTTRESAIEMIERYKKSDDDGAVQQLKELEAGVDLFQPHLDQQIKEAYERGKHDGIVEIEMLIESGNLQ